MNTLTSIIQLVVALSTLIILHELGHFLAARLFKVDVEEFGLGYPPRLLTLFTAGGTKFSLNWLPFGGFVRPKGENDPTISGGLAAAKPWVRLAVFAAGPVMNLLAGVVLYTIIFTKIGVPDVNKVQIISVADNSPAKQAGLKDGDLIVQVNDYSVDSTNGLHDEIYANLGHEISLIYHRDNEVHETFMVPRSNPPEGEGAIGIVMGNPTKSISWIATLPMGVSATARHAFAILTIPAQIIRGAISTEDARLVGYKGMFDIYQQVRESETMPGYPEGINTLGFFTTITISLAILNLLPIPALDGGRILFTLPEILFRRRIPPQLENWINLVSFTLLILIFIYINLLDFTDPVQLPR